MSLADDDPRGRQRLRGDDDGLSAITFDLDRMGIDCGDPMTASLTTDVPVEVTYVSACGTTSFTQLP